MGSRYPYRKGQCCPVHWKTLGVSAVVYASKRIIQSSIMACEPTAMLLTVGRHVALSTLKLCPLRCCISSKFLFLCHFSIFYAGFNLLCFYICISICLSSDLHCIVWTEINMKKQIYSISNQNWTEPIASRRPLHHSDKWNHYNKYISVTNRHIDRPTDRQTDRQPDSQINQYQHGKYTGNSCN